MFNMKNKITKTIITLIIVIVAGAFGIQIFAPQWYVTAHTKYFVINSNNPSHILDSYLKARVVERTLPKDGLMSKKFFVSNGVRFGVPFTGTPTVTKIEGGAVAYVFGDGKAVYIFNKPFNLLGEVNSAFIAKIFSKKELSSDFEFKKTIYNFSTDDLTFRTSMKNAVRLDYGLLSKKGLFVKPGDPPYEITAFQNDNVRGFQISTKADRIRALVEISDVIDLAGINMTQDEIDSIINSISVVK